MADKGIGVKLVTRTPDVTRKLKEIVDSVDGYQVQDAGDKGRTDLLIFELGQDTQKEFRNIEILLNSGKVGDIFLTSAIADQVLLLNAMRAGAKEFFSQPIVEKDVRQALERFRKKTQKSLLNAPRQSGRIINVIGGKGGVGATTIAVNLAVCMALEKSRPSVALVDMNMLFGDIPVFLGFKPSYHWGEVTDNIARLDTTFLMNILSRHSSGVRVLPSPSYLNGHRQATPEIMEHLLGLMQGMFDYIIIDGGQSLSGTALRILDMSDQALLISVLSLPCLSNVTRLLTSLGNGRSEPLPHIKVVVNRYLKKSQVSLQDAERAIERQIFWTIPNDYKTTMAAINQGRALPQLAARAPITKTIKDLASVLISGKDKMQPTGRRFFNH